MMTLEEILQSDILISFELLKENGITLEYIKQNYNETLGWSNIFNSTSVYSGTKFTVNYTSDASSLVDEMIATKSESSNVIKGALVA